MNRNSDRRRTGFQWQILISGILVFGLCPAVSRSAPPASLDSPDAAADDTVVLLRDQFETLPPGPLSKVLWARAEYHFLPECGPKGPWNISCYSSQIGSQRAWKVTEHEGRRVLLQTYTPRGTDRHVHPMVVAGDPLWHDYVLEAKFAPVSGSAASAAPAASGDTPASPPDIKKELVRAELKTADSGRSGVMFRMRNDRCYYFFGVEGDQAILKLVQQETSFRKPFEKELAAKPLMWAAGESLTVRVQVKGTQIRAFIQGHQVADIHDDSFVEGRIGLTSDMPTHFSHVEVRMSPADAEKMAARVQQRDELEGRLQAANPAMKLWKNISLGDFGVGRNVRFGDLDHDGQVDVLVGQMRHHGPKDRFSELSCLTAVTFDGKILWRIGEPDPWKDHLTNDVAFQIQDLDNDGRNEVIYTMDQMLRVVDGATGEIRHEVPTPVAIPDGKNPLKFPRILGDSLFFADLRGRGHADHLVIKDRYTNFWVINSELQTLWHGSCTTGHYPWAMDVDRDGRDELFVGYSLFDDDGTKLWSLDSQIKDHADAVTAVDLHPEKPGAVRVLCAASDEGFYIADLQGNILKRHRIGHAQNLTVANFRSDLPGLEILVHNYWGNQGIAYLFDADGELYHDFEPSNHGSVCLPVNWTGRDEEYWCLSPSTEHGGLFDGLGRRVLKFPADGHPDMCYMIRDVTGDCRDEIIVWDPFELSVYTQADGPRTERLYRPVRNPWFNVSNYGAMQSLPGWSDEPAASQ
jgi:rhamnogalacturonan endolyase